MRYFLLGMICAFAVGCDTDRDGIIDSEDNCPEVVNSDQANLDDDSFGDVCDTDIDGDGLFNRNDNCPVVVNDDQADGDGDTRGDVCDNCPEVANRLQDNLCPPARGREGCRSDEDCWDGLGFCHDLPENSARICLECYAPGLNTGCPFDRPICVFGQQDGNIGYWCENQ